MPPPPLPEIPTLRNGMDDEDDEDDIQPAAFSPRVPLLTFLGVLVDAAVHQPVGVVTPTSVIGNVATLAVEEYDITAGGVGVREAENTDNRTTGGEAIRASKDMAMHYDVAEDANDGVGDDGVKRKIPAFHGDGNIVGDRMVSFLLQQGKASVNGWTSSVLNGNATRWLDTLIADGLFEPGKEFSW